MDKKYKDMLDLEHPEPKKHPRMSRHDRAAQFSPFAALTGFDKAIEKTGRFFEENVELVHGEVIDDV